MVVIVYNVMSIVCIVDSMLNSMFGIFIYCLLCVVYCFSMFCIVAKIVYGIVCFYRACSAVASAPLWYPRSWVRTRTFPQSMLHAYSLMLNEAKTFIFCLFLIAYIIVYCFQFIVYFIVSHFHCL